MVALFLSPASEKGRATLRLGNNMWLYIPSVGKPLRITSLQSVVGGVFNNSDILRIDYSADIMLLRLRKPPISSYLIARPKRRRWPTIG